MMKRTATIATITMVSVLSVSVVQAQTKPAPVAPSQDAAAKPQASSATGVTLPPDYAIGADDVLTITYRNEKEMTGDYIVRPDGKITLPLLGDVAAVGTTPEKLTEQLVKVSEKLFINPTISVGVKAINSRKVSITGGVQKPGQYDILTPMDVLQLISLAGGLREYTSGKNITIIRGEGAAQTPFRFNYKEVLEGRNLKQNIPLKPGDRVLVPE
jgi:polysaccharide export outer membrane protein